MDRQPTQIILSPAGTNSSRRYTKSKNPTIPAVTPRTRVTKKKAGESKKGESKKGDSKKGEGKKGDGAGKPKTEEPQISDRLKAIQQRRERLQAKIDEGRLPPIPPSKNASAGSLKTPDPNSLSPNWKAKESRQAKIATPPKILISQPENHKIKIPIVKLSPLPLRTQSELPSRSSSRKDPGHHEPLPGIKHPPPGASSPPEHDGAPPSKRPHSNPPPSPKNDGPSEGHPTGPAKTQEAQYPQDQVELQLEMQRQMQNLMQQQMRKMQQYFREQQEQQRLQQQQEKEQLMQQLREQQEEIDRHHKQQEELQKDNKVTEAKNEDRKSSPEQPATENGTPSETSATEDETSPDNKDAETANEKANDDNEDESSDSKNQSPDTGKNEADPNNEENESEKEEAKDEKESEKGEENEKDSEKENEEAKDEKDSEKGEEKEDDSSTEKAQEGKTGEASDDEDDIGGQAEDIVQGMQHTDRRIQVSNAEKARQLLSNDKPPVRQLINAGILPVLVTCMGRSDIPDLQLEATWSVTNIASGASDNTWALVEAGAIPPLVDLMKHGKQNVKEQAVWAVGNIIGDGPDCRDEAVKNGVIQPLVNLLSPAMPITLRRQVCWVLTNLFRTKNPDISIDDRKLCANALKELVSHYDAQIQVDSLWATAYFADLGPDGIDDLIQCGVVKELVQRLYSNDERVIAAALRATGTIAAGNNEQTDAIVEAGALPIYRELLKHPTPGIARETAWILSNITAGTPMQIQLIIDVQVVSALMAAAEKDDPELRKEATWALSNLTSGGTPTQIGVLVQVGVLACLCGVLTDEESGMMVVALEAINNIFKKTEDDSQIVRCVEGVGGVKTLKGLQEHDQGEVAKLAKYLIDTYFEGPGD